MKLGPHARHGERGARPATLDDVEYRDRSGLRAHDPDVGAGRAVGGPPARATRGRTRTAYDAQAAKLAGMFKKNFEKFAAQCPRGEGRRATLNRAARSRGLRT